MGDFAITHHFKAGDRVVTKDGSAWGVAQAFFGEGWMYALISGNDVHICYEQDIRSPDESGVDVMNEARED